MENNLSLHLKMFNDKVRAMNQSNSKNLTLTTAEARNLHADIFELLNHCATLSQQVESTTDSRTEVVQIHMDGGSF